MSEAWWCSPKLVERIEWVFSGLRKADKLDIAQEKRRGS